MFKAHSHIHLLIAFALFGLLGTSCSSEKDTKQADLQSQSTGNPKIDKLKLPNGFKAEHLYSPSENKQGSWVSMTFDNKGRMITSDQYGSLYRLTMPPLVTVLNPR
jgi:hypothetical protein